MQEQEASQEETTCLEEVAGSPWEGVGTEVSVDGGVQWVEAYLLGEEWAACWGQREDVQMGAAAGVLSSSQKEAGVA